MTEFNLWLGTIVEDAQKPCQRFVATSCKPYGLPKIDYCDSCAATQFFIDATHEMFQAKKGQEQNATAAQ